MFTMVKRTLAVVVLMGATGTLGGGGAHAASMTTVKGTGYTFQYPSTWETAAKVKLTDLFTTPSLQHLAATATVVYTKDNYETMAAFVQQGAPHNAQLKAVEHSMLIDGSPLLTVPKYQTLPAHWVSFFTGSAIVKNNGKQVFEMVLATQRKGKTFYFLIASRVTTTAKGKAEDNQAFDIVDTITLD
jgi:hypothetical protein